MIVELSVGAALAGLLLKIRQARIKRHFLRQHGCQIRQENEIVAQLWRSSDAREKTLVVERTFRPRGLLTPKIRIRQRFTRGSRRQQQVRSDG